jgi:GH35 family endo-1,4-beta-xylanase
MLNYLLFIFCVSMTLGVDLFAQDPPIPQGKRLRDIVAQQYPKGNLFIGGTTGWRKLSRGSGIVLNKEFSYVTPENDFKQSIIHPKPGVWNWTFADAWIERCAKNNQVLRIHGPISPQCSKWIKDDARTASELKQNLVEYMTALCRRYDKYKHVKWLDVVNETVTPKGAWFGPKTGTSKWENPWPKIGYDKSHPLKPPLYIKASLI